MSKDDKTKPEFPGSHMAARSPLKVIIRIRTKCLPHKLPGTNHKEQTNIQLLNIKVFYNLEVHINVKKSETLGYFL